jgi:diguanylate cyclase (GGDEF)-like protein/PAS domain S-box-containing protein
LAVEQGISLVCRDAETDDRVDRIACRHVGLRSMVVVPLPHQDGYAGVLKVYSAFPNAFTDQDVLTAHLLAGPLAVGFATANEAVAVAERAIADRRFTATFEQAAVGIAHVAHTGHFLLVNRRFCEILGYPPEVLTGLSFQQITHPDDLETDLGYLRTLVAGKIPNYSIEKRYLRADGSALWIKLTVSLVRDGVGGTDFFVAVVEDIDARKRAELESTQDPLTGLLNRRGALGRLERELGRAGLSGDSTIIVFLDLDCFKAVNDSLGHSQGDKCLARVATALTKASRPRDLVCRLGGDEFLVALLGLSAAEAPPVLERLLEAVREEATDGSCPVRASMGAIALSGGVAVPVDQAVAAADRLMYAAKAAGKNCYILESWSSNALAAA